MRERRICLSVNKEKYEITVPVNRTLLQVLREDLGLKETKHACGAGECGACTVLVNDGEAILSCLLLAATMDGKEITTVKGIEKDGELHPVQMAFIDKAAVQCGYCTPGMILKTISILKKNPNPSEKEIKEGLVGNFCRCTGYVKIIKAVEFASELVSGSSVS